MIELSAYMPSSNPKEDIKEPLERTIPHLIHDLVGVDAYSWYASMMLMFNHADFLGHLYSGGSSPRDQAKNAVKFIRKYLGKVNARYEEVGGLLYFMLRHGLTHKSHPKRIRLQDGSILGLTFSDTKNRTRHLVVTEAQGELRLKVSIALFYQDLLAAIDLYCEDISQDQQLRDAFIRAWQMLGKPEEEATLKRKYIGASDLDFIKKYI